MLNDILKYGYENNMDKCEKVPVANVGKYLYSY